MNEKDGAIRDASVLGVPKMLILGLQHMFAMFGATILVPREASEMFQCIKYEDKREVFGLKIHSFSTLDRIKKYDDSDNEENAEKPYSIKVGETKRTINLYAIATTKFQIAV